MKIKVLVEVDLGSCPGECIEDTLDACNCRCCAEPEDEYNARGIAIKGIVDRAIERARNPPTIMVVH